MISKPHALCTATNDHPDFHKVIITVTEQDGSMINLAFIQYYFDNGEHDIDFEGSNSNKSRTLFSTRKTILSLKDQKRKGKKTFHSVTNSVGGFELARTLAELPNSYKHIYDVIRKNDIGKETDELIELLDLCKGQIGTSSAFIRDVRTAPEKSVFLSSDNQLHDIERFCAGNYCWSVLGVDPTFNICDYYVTVSTYKHSLLVKNGTNEHPVMLGPILIHSHKTFDSYFSLPSNLIRLKPSLVNLNLRLQQLVIYYALYT